MGDGEFQGGGSVEWVINNKEDGGGGGAKQHRGKDKGALTEIGDKLLVTCKNARVLQQPSGPGPGTVTVEVTLADDKKQVVLKWGDDANLRSGTQQS